MEEKDNPELQELERLVADLGERYDAVRIFVSRNEAGEEGGTIRASTGCGNWYAQFGQVVQWVKKQQRLAEIEAEAEYDEDGE